MYQLQVQTRKVKLKIQCYKKHSYLSQLNMEQRADTAEALQQCEVDNVDAWIIFLADVYEDQKLKEVNALQQLFERCVGHHI